MASKKSAKKPQGNYMDDFAKAILGAIRAGGKGASKPAPKKLGNLDGVKRGFGGRPQRVAPPSPPKRSGSGLRPAVPMRPVPPSRPAKPAFQERPSVPMRPRPPQPPAKTVKPAIKGKPMPKKVVKPAPKKTPRKRVKGMQK